MWACPHILLVPVQTRIKNLTSFLNSFPNWWSSEPHINFQRSESKSHPGVKVPSNLSSSEPVQVVPLLPLEKRKRTWSECWGLPSKKISSFKCLFPRKAHSKLSPPLVWKWRLLRYVAGSALSWISAKVSSTSNCSTGGRWYFCPFYMPLGTILYGVPLHMGQIEQSDTSAP